jgi:protein O-mannosyl-transferase
MKADLWDFVAADTRQSHVLERVALACYAPPIMDQDASGDPEIIDSPEPPRPSFSALPEKQRLRIGFLLLLALAVLPYLSALRGGFVFDDLGLVVRHPAVQGPFRLWTILTADYWASVKEALLWRPVTTLSFALDHLIAGRSPLWPHLVNVLLHASVTLLWAQLVRRLTKRDALAFVAGFLFAVHPLHTEAVTWISGRAELLAAGFSLVAIHLALSSSSRRRWLCLGAVLLAVGSKESATVLPILLLYLTWAMESRRGRMWEGEKATAVPPPVAIGLASFVPILLYLVGRRFVLGTWLGPHPQPSDNPLVGSGILTRLPTVLDTAGRSIGLLFWPARLSLDYSAPVLALVRAVTPYLLLGMLGTSGFIYLAIRRRHAPEGWGAGFALLTFALTSNLLYVIGTIFGERLLYLPSAGLLLVVTAGGFVAAARFPRSRQALQAFLVIALLAGSVRTWIRNDDFRSDAALYKAEVRVQPLSPKMRHNSAVQAAIEGRYEDAVREAMEAIRLDPTSRAPRETLVGVLEKLGRTKEAINFLAYVVKTDAGDFHARRNLIRLFDQAGQQARGDSLALAGLSQASESPETIAIAALRSQDRGDIARAIDLWRNVLQLSPDDPEATLSIGYCLLRKGDTAGAREAYARALRLAPDRPDAANGLAWALLESGGEPAEAARLAALAVHGSPVAPFYDTLARALLADGKCAGARDAATKAISLDSLNAGYRQRLEEITERCR